MEPQVLRIADVCRVTSLGKSAIYDAIKAGEFPRPIKLTSKASGWRVADINAWLESRPVSEQAA